MQAMLPNGVLRVTRLLKLLEKLGSGSIALGDKSHLAGNSAHRGAIFFVASPIGM
jgi:hypothetical protein